MAGRLLYNEAHLALAFPPGFRSLRLIYELQFRVLGRDFPLDHGYPLYAALSRLCPQLHERSSHCLIGPIGGENARRGLLTVSPRSRLRLRVTEASLPIFIKLAGQSLDLAGHPLRLSVPNIRALVPAPTLVARLVTFRNAVEPELFLATARDKLRALGVAGQPSIPLLTAGPRAGEPHRRVIAIAGRRIIGYSLLVEGLDAAESLRLQEQGLGGRGRMGCGWFVGVRGGG